MSLPVAYERPEARKLILDALRQGATRKAAAMAAGINPDTWYEWTKRDPEMADACAQAEAEAELRATKTVTNLFDHSDGRVQGENARWWLERRRRRDYGAELNLRALPAETLRELAGAGADDYEIEGRVLELAPAPVVETSDDPAQPE